MWKSGGKRYYKKIDLAILLLRTDFPVSSYGDGRLCFVTTPRTKSMKGMKQINPMMKITTTSARTNGVDVKNG